MRKQIQGYDGLYSVDETGTIYGQKGKPLKPYDNGYGYQGGLNNETWY